MTSYLLPFVRLSARTILSLWITTRQSFYGEKEVIKSKRTWWPVINGVILVKKSKVLRNLLFGLRRGSKSFRPEKLRGL